MVNVRKPYPSDVSDEEWALVAPYLILLPETCGQRLYPLREAFNGLRYIVKIGAPWRWMPNDLPPWEIVYQQAQRWLGAGCFAALAEDPCIILRLAAGRGAQPTAAIIDSRTLRSTPESGARAELYRLKPPRSRDPAQRGQWLGRVAEAVVERILMSNWALTPVLQKLAPTPHHSTSNLMGKAG